MSDNLISVKTLSLLLLGAAGAVVAWQNMKTWKKSRKAQEEIVEEEPVIPYSRKFARRNSVSAECDISSADTPTEKIVYAKTEEERAIIERVLRGNILFQSLESEHLGEVIDSMHPRRYMPGDKVIVQGDAGDAFYIVQEGTFDVIKDGVRLGAAGNCFGELALMYNTPRAATIVATGDGPHITWAVDRRTFTRVLKHCFVKQREKHAGFLEAVKLFGEHMDEYSRMTLADAFETREFKSGEIIVREGEKGDSFFVIESGTATVTKKGEEVNRLTSGNYFGELAIIFETPRAATVTATSDLRAAVLDADAFNRLMPEALRVALQTAAREYKQYKTPKA